MLQERKKKTFLNLHFLSIVFFPGKKRGSGVDFINRADTHSVNRGPYVHYSIKVSKQLDVK